MDWLGQATAWLRDWLVHQPWLAERRDIIAAIPDWALLVPAPIVLLLLALVLRRPRSKSQGEAPNADAKRPPPETQTLAEQRTMTLPKTEGVPTASASASAKAAPKRSRAATDDDDDNRSVRVFVSSTFLDMQKERNELVTKVFPALRAKYRARGVEVFEVDLRWGITREQQQRGETLATLLGEIDRCRPYFIGLLGQRYGWIPPEAALTEKLKTEFPAIADAQGASVTAMEIIHGVLHGDAAISHACFFERDPSWDWLAGADEKERAAADAEPSAARAKLAELKAAIGRRAPITSYARPEDIGALVFGALDAMLEARFPAQETSDAFEQSARLHRAYARERRVFHVGAESYVRDLDHWMETDEAPPLLITGNSGAGKSTLIANWLDAWRKAHSSDIVIEHYLGASPDSADPLLIMRRVWEHLNRRTGEIVALPSGATTLMELSAGLAQRLAKAGVGADGVGARVLLAFDGLDKLSGDRDLRWLPVGNSWRVLASSLPGEAQSAAQARGFAPLEVRPLDERERRDFIASTLTRWRRELEPQHTARILTPDVDALAGSPLYLKTILEELRVSADNARLDARIEIYGTARDLPDLFERVLMRLEQDCDPGIVGGVLPFVWASRAGLEEAAIVEMSGVPPLGWATLRNGMGGALRDQAGRIAFDHDFLVHAVERRYLEDEGQKRQAHLALSEYFAAREPDLRQAEELPFQLRAAGLLGDDTAWTRLETLLCDIDRFVLLRARGDGELWNYWLALKTRGRDPEALLCKAIDSRLGEAERWSRADVFLAAEIAKFLSFGGVAGEKVLRLHERCVAACERLYGPDDRSTLALKGELALTRAECGDIEGAMRLEEEVLSARTRILGESDRDTLTGLSNLAIRLRTRGNLEGAQRSFERVLEGRTRVLGAEHADTLGCMLNLALTLKDRGDHAGARKYEAHVSQARMRLLGAEHPDTLTSMNNLAGTLQVFGDFEGAQTLLEQVLETRERILGADHPDTLTSWANLASVLKARGYFERAQAHEERVVEAMARSLGPEHPDTLTALGNLGVTLQKRGDLVTARAVAERVLEARSRILGTAHPSTLKSANNLAQFLYESGDLEGAQARQELVLVGMTQVLGEKHPDTLRAMGNLAATLQTRGELKRALPYQQRVMDVMTELYGADHPSTLTCVNNFARTLFDMGDHKGALERMEQVVALATRRLGAEHPFVRSAAVGVHNIKTHIDAKSKS